MPKVVQLGEVSSRPRLRDPGALVAGKTELLYGAPRVRQRLLTRLGDAPIAGPLREPSYETKPLALPRSFGQLGDWRCSYSGKLKEPQVRHRICLDVL
jgi:hypothetical protein